MIVHRGSKWILYTHDGSRILSEHDSEEGAKKQEEAIEAAKHSDAVTVIRHDRGELAKPVELPNGWLHVDGYIGRSGILEYTRADGTTWREYRPPEEAFHADSLDSFAMVPLTNNHPPGGKLTAENTREFQVGTVERPQRDEQRMRSRMLITDARAIADVRAGKAELSCGYSADVEMRAGVSPNGQRYDAVQRNVRGNHVAIVDRGRAGPQFRIRVDHAGDTLVVSDSVEIDNPSPSSTGHTLKFAISGVEYEVSEQVAQAIAKERTDHAEQLKGVKDSSKTATDENAKLQARADTAESDVKKLQAQLAEAPGKALEAAKARAALEGKVSKTLDGVKLDGLSDVEIKRQFAAKVLDMKLDGKADAYVDAMFDLAVQREDKTPAEPPTREINLDGAGGTKRAPTLDQLVAERNKKLRDAHKVVAS